MAQIGKVDDEEKPIFAGLLPDQKINKITLEETLNLFKLPCYLGDFEDKKVSPMRVDLDLILNMMISLFHLRD